MNNQLRFVWVYMCVVLVFFIIVNETIIVASYKQGEQTNAVIHSLMHDKKLWGSWLEECTRIVNE